MRADRAAGEMIAADTFRLDGRVALVTGSSTGIGLGIARGLAQAGATVVVNARSAARLAEAWPRCAPKAWPRMRVRSTSPTPQRSMPPSPRSKPRSARSTFSSTTPAARAGDRSPS
jgi:hypothetical protein